MVIQLKETGNALHLRQKGLIFRHQARKSTTLTRKWRIFSTTGFSLKDAHPGAKQSCHRGTSQYLELKSLTPGPVSKPHSHNSNNSYYLGALNPPGSEFTIIHMLSHFIFFFFLSKCFYWKQIVAPSKSLLCPLQIKTEHNRGKHHLAGQFRYVDILLSTHCGWGNFIRKQSLLDKIVTPKC